MRDTGKLHIQACVPPADTVEFGLQRLGWGQGEPAEATGPPAVTCSFQPPSLSSGRLQCLLRTSRGGRSKDMIPGDGDTAGSDRKLEGGWRQAQCENAVEALRSMWTTRPEQPSWSRTSKT